MAAWATMERELGTLFALVSGIKPDMAMRVYYSAHSFNSRIGMFQSALIASKATNRTKEIVRLILIKAKLYNSARNTLAHDLPTYDSRPGSPTFGQLKIIDAKAQFQSDEVKRAATDKAMTLKDLERVAQNFDCLARIIGGCWQDVVGTKEPLLERYPDLLAALPKHPHQEAQNPHT